MRVTSEMQTQQTLRNLQMHYARMTKLQDQLASGKRIQRPSDAPADMVQVLQNRAEDLRLDTHLSTIRDAGVVLQTSVDAMTEAREVLTHARDVAIDVNSGSHDPVTDDAFAHEIDVTLDRMLRVANRQLPDGRYLFGGTASGTVPFDVTSSDSASRPATVTYRGSDQDSEAVVGKALSVGTLISGSRVFQARDRQATVFTGATGARPGSGTDNATVRGTLLVKHTLTTMAGASGVSTGSSSATGDTIIGPGGVHSLTINDTSGTGAGGTVSLNGGPPFTFTNADTDLKVTGPNGEVIHLNTTAIVPGFSGNVALTATGTLSVDGGATTIPIDFSANQVVTDGTSGAMTNVDSSLIRQAGPEQLDYRGTSDVFQILIALRDTIRNVQGLSAADRSEALGRGIADLDRINQGIVEAMGSQSVQAEYLVKLQDRTADVQLELQKTNDNLESVDLAGTITALQQQENLYQMSLQLAARMNSLSLADFLT
ncbi:MAG: flagellar hook-associated protein FlgL [Planctomycetota bacterium]